MYSGIELIGKVNKSLGALGLDMSGDGPEKRLSPLPQE